VFSSLCFEKMLPDCFDEASNEKSLYLIDTGTIARVTTLFRLCLAAYASSGFAPMKVLFNCFFQGLKSLSDVTVAPVAPTALFSAPLTE